MAPKKKLSPRRLSAAPTRKKRAAPAEKKSGHFTKLLRVSHSPRGKKSRRDRADRNNTTLFELFYFLLPLMINRLSQIDWGMFLKTLWSENRAIKIFSIFASLFIFFYIKSQDITEKNILIPLRVVKAQQVSIANELPQSISVFLSGTKDALLSLDENQLYAQIDLRKQGEEASISYKPILYGFPNNVQILHSSPSSIDVSLSPLDRKLISVEPELIGAPNPDYYLVRYSIKPTRLWVNGPEDILSDLTTLKTEPISIDNIRSSKETRVLLNRSIHPFIEVDREREFSVFLYIRSKYLAETLEGPFPVSISFPPDSPLFVANPPVVKQISLQILEEISENFDAYESLSFFIRIGHIKGPGVYDVTIEMNPIQGVRLQKISPLAVRLEVLSTTSTPTLKEGAISNE